MFKKSLNTVCFLHNLLSNSAIMDYVIIIFYLKNVPFTLFYFRDNELTVKSFFPSHTKLVQSFPTLRYSLLLQFLKRTLSVSRRLTAEFE